MKNDVLLRFLFEKAGVRGELVHLDATWQSVLERHDYPPVIRDLLGQAMAASALLAATLKFDGSITLQVQGDGPVTLLVVECSSARTLRGLAHWHGEVRAGELQGQFGDARLVITIDTNQGERYQGIVALEGAGISDAIERYLAQSEQLATRLWLAADGTGVAGLLLQKLPAETEDDADHWNRVTLLGDTITSAELLNIAPLEVIRRLFHEEDIRVFDSEPVSFRCTCSRDRVASMLKGLGHDEVNSIIADEGAATVTCEFCNQRYVFDPIDAEQIFAEPQPDVSDTRH